MSDEPKSRNVFISFRFEDGNDIKKELSDLFDIANDTVDYSEDVDRSNLSDEEIKKYLYGKLKRSTVTIIVLTKKALEYKRNIFGKIDDWIYDEVRYSLEDREGNRTNGLIAVYTDDVKDDLFYTAHHKCELCQGYNITIINDMNNLFRKNMMNVKEPYKLTKCANVYDRDYDSYCSLISLSEFKQNFSKYIKIAEAKRNNLDNFDLIKRLD